VSGFHSLAAAGRTTLCNKYMRIKPQLVNVYSWYLLYLIVFLNINSLCRNLAAGTRKQAVEIFRGSAGNLLQRFTT